MSNAPVKRPRGRPRKNPLPEQQVGASVRPLGEAEQPVPAQAASLDTPAALKVHIFPKFKEDDTGGIPRVVEAQRKHLPSFGIEVVDDPEKADIIVAHATVPSSYVKRFPRKMFVSICHGLYWSEYEWSPGTLKVNADVMDNIRVSDWVVTCSEWVANSLRRHTSRPVDVIGHGIDIEDWEVGEHKDYVLWNKTRPDPVCDPEPLNQVALLLPETKFISTFGAQRPNIALTGALPYSDAKKLIANAGVYLCTTRETFGIGTLEAMACGVPVVGFNFGGQAEFIDHGINGWLATPGDIQGLADGIRWAFINREKVGAEARKKAELFDWKRIIEKYAILFRIIYERKTRKGPRTSVIVTNYNLEKYLEDCLKSVSEQTDQDWECIIVDDASPNEEGREIAKAFCRIDKRFKLIENQSNVYLAEARNIGIRAALGRYILPLDADDMLDPEAVELLANALDEDKTIHVAYGGVLFVDEDGKTLADYSDYYGRNNPYGLGHSAWPFPFVHEQQLKQQNLLPYASMYRREAWRNTGGYRRRCRTAEDADMWVRFTSYGFQPKMVTKHDTLIYRNRDKSMSREQGPVDWAKWFVWSERPELTPAGASTKEQMPVNSLDPIIISVIIPVGPGHDKILTDAVDSVDSQTFRNWECIIINDTGHLLETELPQWVKVIDTEGRTGPAHARNVGIKASKGRLFLPLDADDYLEPEALSMMFSVYQQTKDVVYSDFWENPSRAYPHLGAMAPQGVELKTDEKGLAYWEPHGQMVAYNCPDFDPNLFKSKGLIHTVTALTPKAYWEAVGGYDETLPAWEDWDFQLALADKGYCSQRIPVPLFTYRKDTGFRREENSAFFERSKEGILRKWKELWDGGKTLMACSTCGRGRATARPVASPPKMAAANRMINNQEAMLVKYTGLKEGAMPYRGVSGTVYWFAANEGPKYVLAKDLEVFRRYPHDFEIIEKIAAPESSAPSLVASGPPQQ